jgi:hypothetical protein
MKIGLRSARMCTSLLCAGLLTACSSSDDEATGTISVSLMDRPVDNVIALYVTISEIWLKPQGEGPAFELEMTSSPLVVDLLELDLENAALIVDNAVVPAKSYNWLEMRVEDAYAMTDTGAMMPVEVEVNVPSGRIRLVSGFEVGENLGVHFVFHWDVRTALTEAVGQEVLILRPAFRVLEVGEYGAVSGSILATDVSSWNSGACLDDDSDADVGNVVYVYEGAGITPDEIGGPGEQPSTTVDAEYNSIDDSYDYYVALMPGDYTLAFTCQGAIDEDGVEGVAFFDTTHDVSIVAGVEETDLDFDM